MGRDARFDAVDATLLPQFAWNLRWRDRVTSETTLQGIVDHSDPTNVDTISAALAGLAWHQRKRGDFAKAIDTAGQSVQLCLQTGNKSLLGRCYITIAASQIARGRLSLAKEYLTRSLLCITPQDERERLCWYHVNRARMLCCVGEYRDATAEMESAVAVAHDEGKAVVHHYKAWLHVSAGDAVTARAHLEIAETVAEHFQMTKLEPGLLTLRAACQRLNAGTEGALPLLDGAEALSEAVPDRRLLCAIRLERAQCLGAAGDPRGAIRAARAAASLAGAIGFRIVVPTILHRLADFLRTAGNGTEADKALQLARSLKRW